MIHKPQDHITGTFEGKPIKIKVPTNAELISIADIDRTGRIRTNYGDIEALANTMLQVGIEEPIILTPKNKLIKGERRIQAFESLGAIVIPFVILQIEDDVLAAFIATGARKDYTTREIGTIIKLIEERQTIGRPAKNSELPLMTGKTVNIVSQITGDSPAQLTKIKKIIDSVDQSPEFEKFIDDLDSNKKSVNTVHTLVTIKERNAVKVEPAKGETSKLVIDPPWLFGNKTIRGSGIHHYDLMSLDELCELELPIGDEAVVGIFIPNSMKYDRIRRKIREDVYYIPLQDADQISNPENNFLCKKIVRPVYKTCSTLDHVLLAWGLTPKSEIIWYKVDDETKKSQPGPGSYSKTVHETFVIAFKGKPTVPVKRFDSVIVASKTEHSEKPAIFYEMLNEMYPNRDGIEMFAREPHDGFKPWGNEVKDA